jgi:hypothetical protein
MRQARLTAITLLPKAKPAFPPSRQYESDMGNTSVLADHLVQLDCRHNTANRKLW